MTETTATRKPLIAGNWKMNLDHTEAVTLVQKLAWALDDSGVDTEQVEMAVFPPFTDLRSVQTLISADRLPLVHGAQDLSPEASGAFTGDISGAFLARLGCTYVLVGHSERRTIHGEDDQLLARKVKAALEHGLTPILCVGEGLQVRQAQGQVEHCLQQLRGALGALDAEQMTGMVIAYEPVWAIGTGEVAGPEDAQELCAALRQEIAQRWDEATAQSVRLLYGGSVKPDNAVTILAQADVDGVLVGGASLSAEDFASIAGFDLRPAVD